MDRAGQEHMRRMLGEQHGIVHLDRVAGQLRAPQVPDALPLRPLATDPDPPTDGALLYVIADNGAGKVEARFLFPTGSPVAAATEP